MLLEADEKYVEAASAMHSCAPGLDATLNAFGLTEDLVDGIGAAAHM